MTERPARNGALVEAAGQDVVPSVPRSQPDHVEAYLRSLISRCDDPPLIDELTDADLGTPCGTSSIARAAMCWLREKQDDILEARLRQELAEADWLVRYRVREAGLDIHAVMSDWLRVYEVVEARTDGASVQRIAESMAVA